MDALPDPAEQLHNEPVGIVGLGLIGAALVRRLTDASYSVIGYDIQADRVAWLKDVPGGRGASQPGSVFDQCKRILFSLPTHHEVQAVLEACAGHLRAGQIIIDSTTGNPDSSVAIARELDSRGVTYLDATISGNSSQLLRGEVVWMVGGRSDTLAAASDLLTVLGREVFHTGPVGSGAKMKLVTNLVLGLNRAALAEGLALAEALALDASEALRVLRGSAAASRIMDAKGEKMLTREYSPQAKLSQHHKDVRLILNAAEQAGLSLPLSTAHERILEQAEQRGLGELDNCALIEVLRGSPPRS